MEDRLEGKGWRQGDYIRDCWDRAGRRKLGHGAGTGEQAKVQILGGSTESTGQTAVFGMGRKQRGEGKRSLRLESANFGPHTKSNLSPILYS